MTKNASHTSVSRWFSNLGQGLAVWLLYYGFRLLPIDLASAVAGGIARNIGPLLPVSRRARRNLQLCFPDWSSAQINTTVREVWDNLGRTAGEFPHLGSLDASGGDRRIEIIGLEHLQALRDDNQAGIVVSAHVGNWEVLPRVATAIGLPITQVYRAFNTPLGEQVLHRARASVLGEAVPKGPRGGQRLLAALKAGGHLAVMIDQKLNEGLAVPFFGRPAMTTPIVARFALRFRCPVITARSERLAGARFRITFSAPIDLPASGDNTADTLALMTAMNDSIEAWVRDRPGQWLWLHRRWIDKN